MHMPQTTTQIDSPTTLGTAALAAHHRRLIDAECLTDEIDAVDTLILCSDPASRDDVLSLAIALRNELSTLAANSRGAIDFADHDDPPDADRLAEADLFRRLNKAAQAIVRGMIRHTGADSPMVCDWVDRVD
jgi:hypothetical protein